MSNEKEFKDILKDKLAAKEFHFSEDNWKETRAFIDASREDKRKRFAGYFVIAAVLLITGTACFYFMSSDSLKPENSTATALNNKNETAAKTEIAETPANTNENNPEDKPASIIHPENTTNENHSVEEHELSANTTLAASEKKSISVNEEKVLAATKQVKTKTARKIVAAISPANSIRKPSKTKTQKNTTGDKVIPNNKKQNDHEDITAKTSGNSQDNQASTPPSSDPNPTTDVTKTVEPSQTPGTNTGGNTIDSSAVATSTTAANASTTSGVTGTVATAAPLKTDTATAAMQTGPKEKSYRNYFAVEAGANYFLGWKNPGQTDAKGFSPVAGVNYTSYFGKNLMFSTGIYYTSVRNLSYSNKTSSITRYKLGAENDVTVVTPTTLRYVDVPLKLAFTFRKNHALGVGYHFGYLITSVSTVEKYSSRQFSRSESDITKATGYTEGIRSTDQQLSLFYRRRLAKDLYIHMEIMMGLTDVKNNAFFNSNVVERNNGIRLTLIYNLLKN